MSEANYITRECASISAEGIMCEAHDIMSKVNLLCTELGRKGNSGIAQIS